VALVGGVVRDRLLGRASTGRDADLAVEGPAGDIARDAAARAGRGVSVRVHDRFDTATIEGSAGWRVDLAATRTETYRRPGALPDVWPAALEDDLGRRDFSINAMAWVFAREGAGGKLLDPFDGRSDLVVRRIRVLHSASFRDDPTRAFRAVRYANRLDFRVEPRTRRFLRAALEEGAFDGVSGDRLRREIEKIFGEPDPGSAVALLVLLGVSNALHPALRAGARIQKALESAGRLASKSGSPTWLLFLLVWSADLAEDALAALAARLSIAGPARRILERWRQTRALLGEGSAIADPRVTADERIAAAALLTPGREAIRRRLLAGAPPLSISGADLVAAGIAPGPRVGRALGRTRAALAEGRIGSREALEFALAAARESEP
jgi:tRNA nucleotidyltransferase (CCA-adding enzyme)